ncbi:MULTISPECIES: hypothetical protein [Methylobacterium]|jgi:hypothetical protein|uniref:Uncharacterized protein n=2 Tax=Methylobacterium TaxID=407 RepID=A0A2U8VTC3_9HYPH|nr:MULTISPECIES: hypothetical protein [Methylobacterium]AWN36658.1 hypothetical protein DK427_13685 [Methylobacterium radiodurans]GJD54994.1 hypothetical protein IFDJLNFL_0876 [Methylobacterium dankookense]VUF11992.1 hypothetical protein MTDSW087_01680 [Methylobacterium dankookense]
MGRVKDDFFDSLTPDEERELYDRDAQRPGPDEPDPQLDAEPELPFPPLPSLASEGFSILDDCPF